MTDEPVERSSGEAGSGGERSETVPPKAAAKKPAAKKAAPKAKAKAKAKPKPAPKEAAKPAAKKPAAKAKAKAKPAPRRRRDREAGDLVLVRAQARYVRSSARTARLVCDNIRGKSVEDARAILAFSPRHIAEAWSKLLESAIANAENNHDLNGDDLKVHAAFADEGPTLKRFRPRAMGRATRIRKRTSHLTIHLTPRI
jgi:ribosomal protein L22